MAINKRGRKEKLYPKEEIDKIIYEYAESNKAIGNIKYIEVYKYSLQLFERGVISFKLSEDFWRKPFRQGKESIDRFNNSIKESIVSTKSEDISIVNIEDVVYKHHKDIDKMIKLLKPLELQLCKSIERENKATEKVDSLIALLSEEKRKKQELQKIIEGLENLLFQLFEYSQSEDVPLVSMLRTGKTRHKIVENALTSMFKNPDNFYSMFEKNKRAKSNVFSHSIKESKEKTKTLADDYKFI